MTTSGSPRVAQAIHQSLAVLIRQELRDPVFEKVMCTVTNVHVNRDGSVANVYVSLFGGSEQEDKLAIGRLKKAAGFLRGPLARKCGLRRAPELRFFHDRSEEMRSTLREINEQDDS